VPQPNSTPLRKHQAPRGDACCGSSRITPSCTPQGEGHPCSRKIAGQPAGESHATPPFPDVGVIIGDLFGQVHSQQVPFGPAKQPICMTKFDLQRRPNQSYLRRPAPFCPPSNRSPLTFEPPSGFPPLAPNADGLMKPALGSSIRRAFPTLETAFQTCRVRNSCNTGPKESRPLPIWRAPEM